METNSSSSPMKPYKLQLFPNGRATILFRSQSNIRNTKIIKLPVSNDHLTTAIQTLSVSIIDCATSTPKKSTITYLPPPSQQSNEQHPLWRRILSSFSNNHSKVCVQQRTTQQGELIAVDEHDETACIVLGNMNVDNNEFMISCFDSTHPPPISIEPNDDDDDDDGDIFSSIMKDGYKNVLITLDHSNHESYNNVFIEVSYSFSVSQHHSTFDFLYTLDSPCSNEEQGDTDDAILKCFAVVLCPTKFKLENIILELIIDGNRNNDTQYVHNYQLQHNNNYFILPPPPPPLPPPPSLSSSSESKKKKKEKKKTAEKIRLNESWFHSLTNDTSTTSFDQISLVCKQTIKYKYNNMNNNSKITMYPKNSIKILMYEKTIGIRNTNCFIDILLYRLLNEYCFPSIVVKNKSIENIENGKCMLRFSNGSRKNLGKVSKCIKSDIIPLSFFNDKTSIKYSGHEKKNQHLSYQSHLLTSQSLLRIIELLENTIVLKFWNRHRGNVLIDPYININNKDNGKNYFKCLAFKSWKDCNKQINFTELTAHKMHRPQTYVNHSIDSKKTSILQFTERFERIRYISFKNSSQMTYKRIYLLQCENVKEEFEYLFEIVRVNRQIEKLKRMQKRIKKKIRVILHQKSQLIRSNKSMLSHLFSKEYIGNKSIGTQITSVTFALEKGFESSHFKMKNQLRLLLQKIEDMREKKNQIIHNICSQ